MNVVRYLILKKKQKNIPLEIENLFDLKIVFALLIFLCELIVKKDFDSK